MTWWDTALPLELTINCTGERHLLRWGRGRLSLEHHPDLEAELALIALGGEAPTCLRYRSLWEDAITDGGFLAEWVDEAHLTPARLSWLGMALERMAGEGFHEFLRDLPLRRAERMGQFLHRFPRPWLDRAAATISAAVVDGPGVTCDHAVQLLSASVAVRLRRCFVTAVGGTHLTVGTAALVPLSVSVSPTPISSIAGHLQGPDRGIGVEVDPGWLHRVWAAGVGVIDGRLVVDAKPGPDPGRTTSLAVVDWDRSSPEVTPTLSWQTASFVDDRWAMSPSARPPERLGGVSVGPGSITKQRRDGR